MPSNPGKELREALYRARASLGEITHLCAKWGGTCHHTGELMGFQQIDRMAQSAVEDADKALLDYEHDNILTLWYCEKCHTYRFPDGDDELGAPECNHGMFFEDPQLGAEASEMVKITMERIS